jgi:NitT/TauT family transport system permease protein
VADQPDEALHLATAPKRSAPRQAALWNSVASEQTILIVGRILLVVAILALWQYADERWAPDFVISSPTNVAARLVQDLQRATIWHDIATTTHELVLGYALGAVAGIALGFLLGMNRIVRGIFEPVIAAVNAIPKVALAPLFLIAMGLGPASKVAIAAMMVALLLFYNTLGGILVAPRPLIDVLRVMGAGRATIVRKVLLPFLSTYIVAGLKSSVPLATVGVIVGEFIGSDAGIGFRVRQSTDLFDSAGLFSGVLILIVLTLLGNALVQLLERRLLRWQR